MKSYDEIADEYAKEYGYKTFFLFRQREGVTDEECKEIAQRYAKEALKEAAEKIESKISALNSQKIEYRKIDDQYSWHIADDQQCLWKEAKSILNIELK